MQHPHLIVVLNDDLRSMNRWRQKALRLFTKFIIIAVSAGILCGCNADEINDENSCICFPEN